MPYIPLIAAAVLVGADQLIKYWASTSLQQVGTIPLIDGVLHLTYTTNTGAAFSILRGQRVFLIVLPAVVIALVLYMIISGRIKHKFLVWTLCGIIAGGIGNLIDRIRLGHVIDFVDFRLINFAVFNLADIIITCSTILTAIYILFYYDKANEKPEKL